MSTFAERLKKVLDHYYITPYKLAKETTINYMSLSHILSGKFYPSYGVICSLLERFPEVSATWLILGKDSMFQETYIKTEIVSSSSPDLIEAKNSVIAAQGEIIRLKDEKIERLTEELRGFKAAAELLGKEKKNDSVSSPKGK